MLLMRPLALGLLLLAACQPQFRLIGTGDRPGSELGLAAPEAFSACREPGNTAEDLDANGDGKSDGVRVLSGGKEVCRGRDTNLDGKIDTWDLYENGRLTARAHDSDGNGRVDQVWMYPDATRPACAIHQKDKDGDGRGDGEKTDLCGLLAGKEIVPGVPALPPAPTLPPQLK